MEESIRDFKSALALRPGRVPVDVALAAEATAHELNHRARRYLKGRYACAVFHDDAQRLRWHLRQRETIFRLLFQQFRQMMASTAKKHYPRAAALWRLRVETWLCRQGRMSVRQNRKQEVSPTFSEIWF